MAGVVTGMDRISLKDFRLQCKIGLLPEERLQTQELLLAVDIFLDVHKAGMTEDLSQTLDYALLMKQLHFLWTWGEFELLEAGCEVSARFFHCYWRKRQGLPIHSMKVRAQKTQALSGRAIPEVEISRCSDQIQVEEEKSEFGCVDILHETEGRGLYLLNIDPGKKIALHHHKIMSEVEVTLDAGALLQRQPCPTYQVFAWPKGLAHEYQNISQKNISVLCIDRPRFQPADEVKLQDAANDTLTLLPPIFCL
jgi:FolB domain-containing protein